MNYRFITSLEKNTIYCALIDEKDRLIEIHPNEMKRQSLIGNIYIGKVSNVLKGIQAVFVNIGLEKDVFLQFEDGQHFLYTTDKNPSEHPQIGDELIIQITKDAYLAKAAAATSMINLTGRYSVLTYHKNYIGISAKIKNYQERMRLKEIFSNSLTDLYGFILRTNAEYVAEEDLVQEREQLIQTFRNLLDIGKYRTCFQCIYKEPENYIRLIRDLHQSNIIEYVFDDEALFKNALENFKDEYYGQLVDKFKLYSEKNYNLYHLFGLSSKIEKALNENVWLKSGASLVIQPTEALVVIDVNSSKSNLKKNMEDTLFSINMEAAIEIARQIRLRNLSGIIIIDFIDMQKKEHKTELLSSLEKLFFLDRIKTTLVDMTPLGLVEVTRKKTDKNIYEKFDSIDYL